MTKQTPIRSTPWKAEKTILALKEMINDKQVPSSCWNSPNYRISWDFINWNDDDTIMIQWEFPWCQLMNPYESHPVVVTRETSTHPKCSQRCGNPLQNPWFLGAVYYQWGSDYMYGSVWAYTSCFSLEYTLLSSSDPHPQTFLTYYLEVYPENPNDAISWRRAVMTEKTCHLTIWRFDALIGNFSLNFQCGHPFILLILTAM